MPRSLYNLSCLDHMSMDTLTYPSQCRVLQLCLYAQLCQAVQASRATNDGHTYTELQVAV